MNPDWDVAPAPGIELDDDGYLSALPISLAAGPENRVVIGLQLGGSFDSMNGVPRPGLQWYLNGEELPGQVHGGLLVGGGDIYAQTDEPRAMVGRLGMDGHLDLSFGDNGVVMGDGFVESLRLLSDGKILVAGQFRELDGVPATGLAELDAEGQLVARDWPELDVAHVSTALRRPDGRYVLAGKFSTVAGESAYRLARLNDDLTLDETFRSPLEPWQFIDDLQLDSEGRLLIAGERIYVIEPMTNARPVGLQRLLEDGSVDPSFSGLIARYEAWLSSLVEPCSPSRRLGYTGTV